VIGLPPSLDGGLNATSTPPSTPVAVPMTGGLGRRAGTTLFDAADGALVPTALVAETVQV
jgi:hypothetical protein